MKMEMVQTVRIISPALLAVLFLAYRDSIGDGPVPVQGDHTEMKDGAGAAGHIHTQPHLEMKYPSFQLSMTMYMMLKGMTSTATRRSVNAREQIR